MALDKPIDKINEADLNTLIEAGTPELKTLEYKQALPGGSEDAKKEFLADVSSFANSSGGQLIYGVSEDAGVPAELLGVDGEGDGTILQLESMIRDGIAPRIAGIHSAAVRLTNGRTAIVIRIPKSFASPHMVKYKGTSRFFARMSNGKYQLDVDQIRAGFLGSETNAERIRDFRLERIARIRTRDTAVPLAAGPCAVLHIVPVNAFAAGPRYDVAGLSDSWPVLQTFTPLFSQNANINRINFDGLLVWNADNKQTADGFTQIYRDGTIETANTGFLSFADSQGHGKAFSNLVFEVRLVRTVERLLTVLHSLSADLPLLLMVSLLDVRGYAMGRTSRFRYF